MVPPPPNSTLFPYTTLFRSAQDHHGVEGARHTVMILGWDIDTRTRLSRPGEEDRKSTRLNSSHLGISYAVFCLKKKRKHNIEVKVIIQQFEGAGGQQGGRR